MLLLIAFSFNVHAYWFIANEPCNIMSGPGSNFKIIGKLKKWEVVEVAPQFEPKGALWISIEPEVVRRECIEEGWYYGSTAWPTTFLRYDDGEEIIEDGTLIKKLQKKKTIYGSTYFGAKYSTIEKKIIDKKWVCKTYGKVFKNQNSIGTYIQLKELEKIREEGIREFKFPIEIQNLIIEGKLRIGMTKNMVLLSWGKPKDINKTITAHAVSEQWVYERSDGEMDFLYFENGILAAIQTD